MAEHEEYVVIEKGSTTTETIAMDGAPVLRIAYPPNFEGERLYAGGKKGGTEEVEQLYDEQGQPWFITVRPGAVVDLPNGGIANMETLQLRSNKKQSERVYLRLIVGDPQPLPKIVKVEGDPLYLAEQRMLALVPRCVDIICGVFDGHDSRPVEMDAARAILAWYAAKGA